MNIEFVVVNSQRETINNFGFSVHINGSTLAVGSRGTATDEDNANSVSSSGAVYIYVDSAGTYTLQKKLSAFGINGRNSSDNFGEGVRIYGDTLLVRASNQDYDAVGQNTVTDSGAVYTFYRSGTNWYRGHRFVVGSASMRAGSDNFGASMISYNGEIILGSPGHDFEVSTGSKVYIDKGSVITFGP